MAEVPAMRRSRAFKETSGSLNHTVARGEASGAEPVTDQLEGHSYDGQHECQVLS